MISSSNRISKFKNEVKRNKLADVIQTDGQKNKVLNIAMRMSKTKQDNIGEQCRWIDIDVLEVYDEGKKKAWTNCYEMFLSTVCSE